MITKLHCLTIFLCLSLPGSVLLPAAQAGASQHPRNTTGGHELLYRITKPASADTSYLFGTFHLLGQDYVDTMRNLMNALHRADVVVGEFSVSDFKLSDLTGDMQSPVPLDSLLTPRDYSLVAKELKQATGLSLSMFNTFKPMVIYGAIMSAAGLDDTSTTQDMLPMDLYFQQVAKDSGRHVMGLETALDQSAILYDSISLKEQTAMLLDFVKHPEKNGQDFDDMQRDYMAGKIAGLIDDLQLGGLSVHDKDLFLYRRNDRWLNELPAILDNHNAFIAVGAGHLVGSRGLVAGLKKLGYKVTGLSLN